MKIVNYEGKNKLRLSLPPQSLQYIFIQCMDQEQEFSCELTQRFSIKQARVGGVFMLIIYVIIIYNVVYIDVYFITII